MADLPPLRECEVWDEGYLLWTDENGWLHVQRGDTPIASLLMLDHSRRALAAALLGCDEAELDAKDARIAELEARVAYLTELARG